MPSPPADPRSKFIQLIDLNQSRVQLEPRLLFICGGPVDIKATGNHSIRNMFMNLAGATCDNVDGFVLAENFKDWERGYKSLSDFENDIAFLSSLVVIFLESEGALTEFGLFFANESLRSKLVVVLHDEFHGAESFIKFGLLDPLERNDQKSVRVYSIDHRKIENVSRSEVKDILDDVIEYSSEKDKTEKFDKKDRGHFIFLIYQIIDLLISLTKGEIQEYLSDLGYENPRFDLDSALYVLQKFNLVGMKKKSSQYFYFVPNRFGNRIDFYFSSAERRYDPVSIKIEVNNFYLSAAVSDRSHKNRIKVIEEFASGGEP